MIVMPITMAEFILNSANKQEFKKPKESSENNFDEILKEEEEKIKCKVDIIQTKKEN